MGNHKGEKKKQGEHRNAKGEIQNNNNNNENNKENGARNNKNKRGKKEERSR